jgi:hypothetical protein
MVDQQSRRSIGDRPVLSEFIIVLEAIFNFSTGGVKAHEPLGVQTLGSEPTIEAFPSRGLQVNLVMPHFLHDFNFL